MDYRHVYEPNIRWKALAMGTLAIAATVMVLDVLL